MSGREAQAQAGEAGTPTAGCSSAHRQLCTTQPALKLTTASSTFSRWPAGEVLGEAGETWA